MMQLFPQLFTTLLVFATICLACNYGGSQKGSRGGNHRNGTITFDKYYRVAEIYAYLDYIAGCHKSFVRVENIGKSYEGRDLKVVKISRGGKNNPSIWLDAGIHAREWVTPAMALFIIQELVENKKNKALSQKLDWYIMPVMNPDGYEYSHTNYRMWRKNRRVTGVMECDGVDLNRNWDYFWDGTGYNGDVCSETYAGEKPFSEPEPQAVMKYILAHSRNMKLYITFHSFGRSISYPWGYTTDLPPDAADLHKLAQAASKGQEKTGGLPYSIGSSGQAIAIGAGGSDDWAKAKAGIKYSYTVELPPGQNEQHNGFILPPKRLSKTVQSFWGALPVFANKVKSMKKKSGLHYSSESEETSDDYPKEN